MKDIYRNIIEVSLGWLLGYLTLFLIEIFGYILFSIFQTIEFIIFYWFMDKLINYIENKLKLRKEINWKNEWNKLINHFNKLNKKGGVK